MFPGSVQNCIDICRKTTGRPHGYLVLDSKQSAAVDELLKINIFGDGNPTSSNLGKQKTLPNTNNSQLKAGR